MPLINISEQIYLTLSLRISVGKLGVYPAWQWWQKSGCKSNAFRQSFKFFHENVFCQISSCIPLLISDMLQFIMVGLQLDSEASGSLLSLQTFPPTQKWHLCFHIFLIKITREEEKTLKIIRPLSLQHKIALCFTYIYQTIDLFISSNDKI